jgi:hypothetical protein
MPRTPLWRNILRFAGPAVLAVGVIVFIVARTTGNSGPAPKAAPIVPPNNATASAADQKALTPAIREIATKFILTTATLNRPNAVESWAILDPDYPGKSDFTKASWAKGDIPVIPVSFPFTQKDIRLSVQKVYPENVVLDVVVIPPKGDKSKVELFELGVHRHGTGSSERWLVDYWQSRYRPGVLGDPSK